MISTAGGGVLTLSNSNSYLGPTAINGGVLSLGNAAAIPSGGSGGISFGGGTLQFTSASHTQDYSNYIASSGSAISIDTNGQSVTFNGTLASSNSGG